MARQSGNGISRFENEDLVLRVSTSVDRRRWDENRYEPFIDALCGNRLYQAEAIRTALRFMFGGEYQNTKSLAEENFDSSLVLRERYGTKVGMTRHLTFPDKLAATLDLATGTGKSYVMYGVAMIALAEGIVDRVLLLCPSTTIEYALLEKFAELAARSELRDLLPQDAAVTSPRIIDASESIVAGSICIENYHAVLAHVRSSIRDSLNGKGKSTLVLNDEAHHVANAPSGEAGKWHAFVNDEEYGFRYVLGLSGTCYRDNEYFSDVIYRYSLRQAIEERFVKKIEYVAEMPRTRRPAQEKWQLVLNRHEEIRKKLKPQNLRPLTIVVTRDIRSCKAVTEELKAFLVDEAGKSRDESDDAVLAVYTDAPGLPRLATVDADNSKVEWILSVAMLNEGWDVKRVFQIVPHEKRAFDSKLLIAQVLGRGLRVPEPWKGPQPVVTVFNHDNWADDIRHLVYEVMELEKRIPTFTLPESEFNFELTNIDYNPKPYIEESVPMNKKYTLFAKGFIDLSTEQPEEEVKVTFEEADTGSSRVWKTRIKHKTYTSREVAEVMHQRLEDLEDDDDRVYYTAKYPVDALEEIVERSLVETNNKVITESMRQKFLQSLGTLQRKATQVVRYDFEPKSFYTVHTADRPQESASASELRRSKTLYATDKTKDTIPDEALPFYEEIEEPGRGAYKFVKIANHYDLKAPLNAVLANHDNERRFINEVISSENVSTIDAWIKSTDMGFYEIDYFWKKGEHPKRGRFNPDFFIKIKDLILVVEIKDDDEISEPSQENIKKYEYAVQHFDRVNDRLKKSGPTYKFNFLTPSDYSTYFRAIRDGSVGTFRSALDVELSR